MRRRRTQREFREFFWLFDKKLKRLHASLVASTKRDAGLIASVEREMKSRS